MDKSKSQLLEVLSKKGIALCDLYQSSANAEEADQTLEEITNVYNEIVKFVEPSDTKVCSIVLNVLKYSNLNVVNR